jgi:hypothetical protein
LVGAEDAFDEYKAMPPAARAGEDIGETVGREVRAACSAEIEVA